MNSFYSTSKIMKTVSFAKTFGYCHLKINSHAVGMATAQAYQYFFLFFSSRLKKKLLFPRIEAMSEFFFGAKEFFTWTLVSKMAIKMT